MLLTGNQRAVSVQARRFSLRSRAMTIEPPSSGAAAHSGRAGRRHLTSRVASLATFALALQIATASAAPDGAPVDASGNEKERSEEHTSELTSLMRISYAVFCLKKTHQHTEYQQ